MSFFLYGVSAIAGIWVTSQLFRLHSVHSLFYTCGTRTDTRYQTTFKELKQYYLPDRAHRTAKSTLVSFEFEKDAVIVEVPTGSRWRSSRICHRTLAACRQAYLLKGHWKIGQWVCGIGDYGPLDAPPELVGLWRAIGPSYDDATIPCRLRLYGSEQGLQLDHMVASAIQDSEVYFTLCTTPLWLRVLYFSLKLVSPSAAEGLLRRVLWVQLRSMFFCHDTWEYRGFCGIFTIRYPFLNKPKWVKDYERWTEHYASEQFLRFNYWVGRLLLGMQGSYAQYEFVREK